MATGMGGDNMRTLRIISLVFVLFWAGCSSLPKETVQHTERNEQASSFLKMGLKQHQGGHYPKACAFFKKALASYSSVDDGGGVAESYCGLGRSQMAMEELEKAETSFQQAHLAAKGSGFVDLEAQALGGLGAVALHRNQPDQAISLFEKALALPLVQQSSTRATVLHDLGAAHQKLGDNSKALPLFESALGLHETLRDLMGIATDCYSLALMYEAENNNVLALEYARRALNHDKRAENPYGVAQDLTLLGTLSSANGQEDQAQDYLRRANLAWGALGRSDQCQKITSKIQGTP